MDKVNGSYSPIYTILNPQYKGPAEYNKNQVDMKDLYSEEELDSILSRFDCLHKTFPKSDEKCDFDMVYLPEGEHVIINNRNMTNDTVEIYRNGQAISVGSWHHKALDGDYSDIIQDVKARNQELNDRLEQRITNQLDSLAELGKSQVK